MSYAEPIAALVVACSMGCSSLPAGQADLVLADGVVWAGGEGDPYESLAIREGRIVAVGDSDEVERWIGPDTRTIDLRGRAVVPGFIDSHVHFLSGGFQLSSVDLRDAASPEEFARRIGEFAATLEPGTWITGGDWDHERWGGELPRREWVDSITARNPIFVNRLDGHMALANSLALEAAGVTVSTRDPAGGTVVRGSGGEPTGVLKDAAMNLVFGVIPESSEQELDGALRAAAQHALSLGVTQVHDMGDWPSLETYRRAHATGDLPLRVYSVVPLASWSRLEDFMAAEGSGDERLWWGGLKGFVDGSLGSTTAWFYEPYDDEPSTSGLMTTDTASMREWIRAADAADLQVIVHAIGDRANDWLLDVYEAVDDENPPRDRRFRIEHAQHLTREAIERFASLGVVASMQPYHAADDGRWAEKRIGPERILTTYAFRSLLEADATLAFGSDWTVAPLDPILGLDAAVTRRTLDGANPGGWVPGERLSLEATLRAYTRGGAYAGFRELDLGNVEERMLADLVILSADIFQVAAEDLVDVRVDATLVEGEVVYEREREEGR